MTSLTRLCSLICCLIICATVQLFPQETVGVVTGVVSDSEGNPLPSATVRVVDSKTGTITDRRGSFRLLLAPGPYTLEASYLGYKVSRKDVKVESGKTTRVEIALAAEAAQTEEVIVHGTLTRGQAKALNEQKNAANIKNVVSNEQFSQFPDRNAAESVQRIPGVSIQHDQGEGETVQVRGVPQQYNSVSLNGNRIPSPDPGDGRAVGLDLLQAELLESIVVTKALTPDMDADALGGTVDFRLRRAPEGETFSISLAAGLNAQRSEFEDYGNDLEQAFGVYGTRLFEGRLGVLLSGSLYRTNKGSILEQYTYTDEESLAIEEKRWNDYDVRRTRYGAVAGLDYRFNSDHDVRLTFNFNRYIDDEIRRKVDYIVGDGEEERETRNRREDQQLAMVELAGQSLFGGSSLDYAFVLIESQEELPDRTYWRYARDVNYEGLTNDQLTNLTGLDALPDNGPLTLNRLRYDIINTDDRDISGRANFTLPLSLMGLQSSVKVGAKLLQKERNHTRQRFNTRPESDADITTAPGSFGMIDIRFDDPEVGKLGLPAFSEEESRINEAYSAKENILAAYAMATLNWSESFTSLVGARFEQTNNEYEHVTAPEASDSDYNNILPSLHLTYRLDDNTNLRLAATTGLGRPNYTALVPREVVDEDDGVIDRGNPDLDPATSLGGDLFFEHYSSGLGLLSVGGFFKTIKDPLSGSSFTETRGGDDFRVSQPINGEDADLWGFEIAFNQQLDFLGLSFLQWFSIYANYSFTDTKANFTDREDLPLPGSPAHTANLALMYDNTELGLSLALTNNYRSKFLRDVGGGERSDVWIDEEIHLDFAANQTLSEQFAIFLQLNNITDQEEKEILGDPGEDFARVQQTEGYGIFGSLGVRVTL